MREPRARPGHEGQNTALVRFSASPLVRNEHVKRNVRRGIEGTNCAVRTGSVTPFNYVLGELQCWHWHNNNNYSMAAEEGTNVPNAEWPGQRNEGTDFNVSGTYGRNYVSNRC